MTLIVGLGNPGEKYENTRHNVGFIVLDFITQHLKQPNLVFENNTKLKSEILKLPNTIFAKPQTFMNTSGDAVARLLNFYSLSPDSLYVIHDDLDLPLGEYKIQQSKGPKVHGGVNSIEEKIGTKDFWRVRIGVDNRDTENRIPGEEYVLQNFRDKESEVINRIVTEVANHLRPQYE